jgi:hypothetical protein
MSDRQFKHVYKSAETTCTWYYDLNVFRNGPIRVEIEYHDGLVELKPKERKTKVTKKPKVTKPKAKTKPKAEKVDKNVSKWFDV